MPLPHFLLLIAAVILAAAVTLWASFAAGMPELLLGLVALGAAGFVHLSAGKRHDTNH